MGSTIIGATGLELLTIVFIVLKILGKITWSWWWVLAPTWIPIAIAIVILILFGFGWLLYKALGN